MTNEEREKYLVEKLNEIRKDMFSDFDKIGRLNISIDYEYVSCFSSSHCEDKKEQVNFSRFYKADGEVKY